MNQILFKIIKLLLRQRHDSYLKRWSVLQPDSKITCDTYQKQNIIP